MKDKKLENLIVNLEKEITNNNLRTINNFEYFFATYNIKSIMNQELQEKFLQFLKDLDKSDNEIYYYDIANFFLLNRIRFDIKFNYIKEIKLISNLVMWKLVTKLKLECLKLQLKDKYIIQINNKKFKAKSKEYDQYGIDYFNRDKHKLYRLSVDLNIQWKPSHKSINDNRGSVDSYSWLMFQFVKVHKNN